MSFGLDSSNKYSWSLDEAQSIDIIERAIDLGITFFDTANSYSWGDSERVLGKAIDGHDTDALVIASKVFNESMENPHANATGLSRKTIDQELDHTLDRLGLESLDLYQIHRWDYATPIEETVRALNAAITDGRTRYIGASSMWTHQLASALHTADSLHLDRFKTMQNHYNLVYREEEREMLPYCQDNGIGVIPWAPLAGGFLARPYEELESTKRGQTSSSLHRRPYADNGGIEINERVQELANENGASMAQIAIAWLLHKDWVSVPIVGATKVEHIDDTVEALDISLSSSDISYLEEPYEPVRIAGHE
jgi:aryl-alcohol dehydrogenase-like predicted oxidoreductase